MLESKVIFHGSPTLARLKVGSLFNINRQYDGFEEELDRLNEMFRQKDLELTILREKMDAR